MKRALILLFLLGSLHLQAAPASSVRELFLSLPDSVFTGFSCFQDSDSFSPAVRKRMLTTYDSAITEFKSDCGMHFLIRQVSDSLGRIVFDNFGDCLITIQLIETGKKEIFFCIAASSCDFVACRQSWNFYLQKKNKISIVKDVLPVSYPMQLFFDTTYLAETGIDPGLDIRGTELSFDENSRDIIVHINSDYFDQELFGEEHPMVKLDPGKMICTEIRLQRNGYKYQMSRFIRRE